MSILYIKDIKNSEDILNEREKNLPKFVKMIVSVFKYRFCKFYKNDNIVVLSIKEGQIISNKKIERMIKNLMKMSKCKSVVLCESLNDNEKLKNVFNSYNVDILNGKYLFRFLVFKIIDFILEKKNKKIQDIELSVMINELDEINIKSIFLLAKKVKRLNIVTNHIDLFKRMEQKLYEEGIMIMISNNKRKSLLKSDIVLNMDFVEENLKEYKFNNKCTIVNICNDIKLYIKGFNGININNYNINFDNVIIEDYSFEFDKKLLYESKIYGSNDFDKILNMINFDNVTISEVIGNKGCAIIFD